MHRKSFRQTSTAPAATAVQRLEKKGAESMNRAIAALASVSVVAMLCPCVSAQRRLSRRHTLYRFVVLVLLTLVCPNAWAIYVDSPVPNTTGSYTVHWNTTIDCVDYGNGYIECYELWENGSNLGVPAYSWSKSFTGKPVGTYTYEIVRHILGFEIFETVEGPVSIAVTEAQPQQPVFPAVDGNGVDVVTGQFVYSQTDVVIGQPGAGGLAYTRYYGSVPGQSIGGWTHNHSGYVVPSGTTCKVVLGVMTETFTSSSPCQGPFTSDQQRGSTLVDFGTYLEYSARDGSKAVFDRPLEGLAFQGMSGYAVAYLTSTTTPEGAYTEYQYTIDGPYCTDEWCTELIYHGRLVAVYNDFGYRLVFEYPQPPSSYVPPNEVTGINAAVENCAGSNCSLPWPSVSLTYLGTAGNRALTATNALGSTTSYTYYTSSGGWEMAEVQFADHADHDINIFYHASGHVAAVNRGFAQWSYGYVDAGGQRTTTVTNPDATTRVYVSSLGNGRITSVTNELSQTLSYQYDGPARPTKVIQPEGNYTQYTYGSRGNLTETRHVAKTPGIPADIVTSATYPASCTNPRTCNKPTETFDARGYRTDYTYDSTHGGMLTVTAPAPTGAAPTGSGARPQTRFEYAQFQARYMDFTGAWINGAPVWRPTKQSACSTGAPGCLNTVNEARVTTTYPSSSTPNNLLPTSTTSAAGDGSVSATTAMTYTNWSDVLTVDGPLSGAADTARFYYDAGRRLVGVVGPDPDGGGPLLYRAARTTYTPIGQPTVVERGTVTNQGDAAFSSFTVLEKQETGYDSFARPIVSRLWDGASIVALTQASYDTRGRPQCNAVRMNSAIFASPPADACTLGSEGLVGPDRITRNTYDYVGRVSLVQSAYGTPLAQSTAAYTYTTNGQVETLTDARSYLTRYEYDGFDRLVKRSYPHPSNPNTSSTTDYEQLTYDAFGRLEQERRRSGESFVLSYDNLGRVTFRNAPGSQPDVSYGYDLLNRLTSESQTGNSIGIVYNDALSRNMSMTSSVLGTVSYQSDAGGRRTRMDYPGGFFVTYAHNTAGDLTGILENGATSLATYEYDNLGRRTKLTRGNGVVTDPGFDAVSRLETLTQDPASTTHDTTFTLGYNPASQTTSRTRTNGVYDWVPPASSNESYTADGLNRYTSALGATPTYDIRGNLTGDGTKTYGYDFDNRMTSASGNITLGYDPLGRLHEVAGGTTTTRFLYDGADVIAEYDTGGTVLRRYVHGPGADEPLVWYEGSGISDRRWLIADERGSVIGTTNGSGIVTDVNRYDVYGLPDAANQGRFQYTGQMWIAELGLYHYKARAYHPRLGRFLQTDPIGYADGTNLYSYVGNDPANRRDPTGLHHDCNNSTWDIGNQTYVAERCDHHDDGGGRTGGGDHGGGGRRPPPVDGQVGGRAPAVPPCRWEEDQDTWKFTANVYQRIGGEITVGQDQGNSFVTLRFGFGAGIGASISPLASIPGEPLQNRNQGGVVLSASAEGKFAMPFVNAEVGVGAARNYAEGVSSIYGGPDAAVRLKSGGYNRSVSLAPQITFYLKRATYFADDLDGPCRVGPENPFPRAME